MTWWYFWYVLENNTALAGWLKPTMKSLLHYPFWISLKTETTNPHFHCHVSWFPHHYFEENCFIDLEESSSIKDLITPSKFLLLNWSMFNTCHNKFCKSYTLFTRSNFKNYCMFFLKPLVDHESWLIPFETFARNSQTN